MKIELKSYNEIVEFSLIKDIKLVIKREDKLHEHISGNKYRKLKYNLITAKEKGYTKLLTFGGAYSNHITATAAAGSEYGFETIGIIRGDELADKIDENPTLRFAKKCGMQFKFVTREHYRIKTSEEFINSLYNEFGNIYILPEGGTNNLAVKGCEEILTEEDAEFDYVCTAVGTGGTIAGLINSAKKHQKVLGFPALKGEFLVQEIKKISNPSGNWKLIHNYHFGGYGKINNELIAFINQFKQETNIPLDPVYTGKMLYGIVDMTLKGDFKKGSKILAIHTGGLQGIEGMNMKLQHQDLYLIN
ncbi:MAG: pyridoxal-phosphate dependent enzyme [Flavobacteriaceae bacterium]